MKAGKLTPKEIDLANQYAPLLSFTKTWDFHRFMVLPHKVIAAFTGNQRGKTAHFALNYVWRILGWHPIPQKNVLYFECPNHQEKDHPWKAVKLEDGSLLRVHKMGLYSVKALPENQKCHVCGADLRIHKRKTTIFRFASEVLPGQKETAGGDDNQSAEVKNATYPEFKKWLPAFLIKKDITARNTSMTIHNPMRGWQWGKLQYDGPDIVVEWVSYSQSVQSGAGVQRLSVWEDEEPPMPFHEEQLPRLLAEDGDLLLSLTPANKMSWTFDEVFERAKLYVRTPSICEYLNKDAKDKVKQIEHTESDRDIAIIQASTYDNPTLLRAVIDQTYMWDDEDTIATRLYGLHRQSSGRIFPTVDFRVHLIDAKTYFEDGAVPQEWCHARMVDFHERNPWACVWIAMSPHNEAFVYREWAPSPMKWVNLSIAQEMAYMSGKKQRFSVDLIDPLAAKIQTNSGISVIQDLNTAFQALRKTGDCSGANWESWDTKGLKGRDEIRKRCANSVKVGKPFNNEILQDGARMYLPTLWIFNDCREVARSLKHWRYEDWAEARDVVSKDRKETPTEKYSHFCTALEAIFKDIRFRPRVILKNPGGARRMNYYQAGR